MTATTVIRSLSTKIFAYFRLSCYLKSDNSNSFTNSLLKEVCNKLQISCETIPAYNYWSNITERFHLDLERFLRAMLKRKEKEAWADQLPWICLAANSTIHSTAQRAPFFPMLGRQPNIPINIAHWALHVQETDTDNLAPFPQKAAEHAAKIEKNGRSLPNCQESLEERH